jgi:hypothetical protein
MVGLKFIKIKKASEEVRRQKAKSALKMGGKDNVLTGLRLRLPLLTGNAAPKLFRYSPGPVEPAISA